MNEELRRFVRESLERGVSREVISAALAKARWRREDIAEALGAYMDDPAVGIPVPWRKPSLSASEAFQYLMTYLTLAISAFALGNLGFNFVNMVIPDRANEWNNWSSGDANLSIASLLVAGPVYVIMSALISNAVRADPAKRDSAVRKWLTYLTLFVAGGTAIGDIITLIYGILEGSHGDPLVARFFLKVAVVLAISSAIFFYYLRDLRKDERTE